MVPNSVPVFSRNHKANRRNIPLRYYVPHTNHCFSRIIYLKNLAGSNFKQDTWVAYETVQVSHVESAKVLISA